MADEQTNLPEFTVSELSFALKRTVEDGFAWVRVRGEIGRVSRPASGHVYLSLKDDRAVLDGVIWKGMARTMTVEPEQGLEIIATGRMTTYPGQSKYQIVIERMEPAGVGALMALLEERRKKLAAEGLFDVERKKPLPALPRTIGIVTSPSGAVIRDILHRIGDRFPLHVLVWPTRVQGEGAAEEIARGITGFNALEPGGAIPRPDIIIVARGGGSLEDLWCFNEEIVVRAAAGSEIPLISAVGHETDWTLIDHAADMRAPTPTAAAEIAVPVRADLLADVDARQARLRYALNRLVSERRGELRAAARGLPRLQDLVALPRQRLDIAAGQLRTGLMTRLREARHRIEMAARGIPKLRELLVRPSRDLVEFDRRKDQALRRVVDRGRDRFNGVAGRLRTDALSRGIADGRERLDIATRRIDRAFGQTIERARERVARADRLRETLGYRATLQRGFVLVRDGDGEVVRSASKLATGRVYDLEFADGHADVMRAGDKSDRAGKARSRPVKQGDLFGG